MAPRGESHGCVEHGAPGLLLLLFEPRERIACVLDLLKLTFALLEVGQHVLDRGAVLLLQAIEPIQPALHVVKLMRRKIEALALILHRRRDVVDLAVDVLQPLIDLGEAVVEVAHRADGILRLAQKAQRTGALVAAV